MKIKIVLLTALVLAFNAAGFAHPSTSTDETLSPEALVANLYNSHKAGAIPFSQTKDRALVDQYFTKDFADLIWNDAMAAKGEVGAFNFDPLYNAQDTVITAFKIGSPIYGKGNPEAADVPVTFKNTGKAQTVLFRLERNSQKLWKISDVNSPSNPKSSSSLKSILSKASTASAGSTPAHDKKEFSELILKGDKEVQEAVKNGLSPDAVAQTTTVKQMDLDKDGQPEYVVVVEDGLLCGALANCPTWVYRKTGAEYQLLLRTFGRELKLQKTLTNKYFDLRSEGGDTALQGSFVDYTFDGQKYVAKGCYTRTYATKTQKEKIAPIKCEKSTS